MFALPIVFILLAGLARTSPAGTVPPASTITPAPVLDRRYLADDFVGYAFMDDGDSTSAVAK